MGSENRGSLKARAGLGGGPSEATGALWGAIRDGDDDAAMESLASAEVQAVNSDGRDALMWAAFCGRPAIVRGLIPRSDLSATDAFGRDALMWAAAGGCGESTSAIAGKLSRDALERVDRSGESAIAIAARAGRSDALRELCICHPRSRSDAVEAALSQALEACPLEAFWIAADHLHPGAVAKGIERIAPTAKDGKGQTALHVAAKFGLVGQVGRLLALGADPRARDAGNATPLMSAAAALSSAPDADVLEIVLALAPVSDPMWEDDRGFTALSVAAKNGRAAVVEALLPLGDADSASHAHAAAVRGRQSECVAFLAPRVARHGWIDPRQDLQGKILRKAASGGDAAAIQKALKGQPTFANRKLGVSEAPPVAERADAGGRDALMLAAKHGRAERVEALLPFSNPRRRDALGKTALMHAAESSSAECARLLAPASNLSARDRQGLTALMWAAKSGVDSAEILESLLPGSVVDAVDRMGRDASFHAVESGSAQMASRLRQLVQATGVRDALRE